MRTSIAKLEARREGLLAQYRAQQGVVGRLNTELREAGQDPETINHRAVLRMGRREAHVAAATWREQPATARQRETLAEMLDRRGMPAELIDEALTKGQADQAIRAALDGRQPALAFPAGEVTTPFVVPQREPATPVEEPAAAAELVPAQPETAAVGEFADPRQAVIDAVVARACDDAGLIQAAEARANTHDHYIGWAVKEAKSQAFSALAEVMDEGHPQLRKAARTLLADDALWSEVPRQIAEQVWQTHRGEPTAEDAAAQDLAEQIVTETGPGPEPVIEQIQESIETDEKQVNAVDELHRQTVAQTAIDVATITGTADWRLVGRDAFDGEHPTARPEPTENPLVAEALTGVRPGSKVAQAVHKDFIAGYAEARAKYLAPEIERVNSELADDPEVVAYARAAGVGPRELYLQQGFKSVCNEQLSHMVAITEARAAALEELRSANWWMRLSVAEQAVDNARADVPSPFQDEAAQEQWRQWAGERLAADPFISTWIGLPGGWPRDNALNGAVERLTADFPNEWPELATAMTSIDYDWLAADARQIVHHNLPTPDEPHPVWRNTGASGWKLDRPGARNDIEVSYRMGRWELSQDGGSSWTSFGDDYRAAQGYAEKLAGAPSTPQVRECAEAVEYVRDEIGRQVKAALDGDELIDVVARSEFLMSGPNGAYSQLTWESVRRALADVESGSPQLIADAARYGLDPEQILREDAVPALLADRHRAAKTAGEDLFTAQSQPDLHIFSTHTLIVGDPQGRNVEIHFPAGNPTWHNDELGIETDTATAAIEQARTYLTTGRAPESVEQAPRVEAVAEADAENTAAAAPAEPETPAAAVEYNAVRDLGGTITYVATPAPEPAEPETPAAAVEYNGVRDLGGDITQAATPEALPQVPQSEMGEPLSSWAGKTLVEAQRPDGSRVRVSAETLAGYSDAPAIDEPDPTIEAPQAEVPVLQAPEAVEAEPRAPTVDPSAVDFELGTEVRVPVSPRDRIEANIAAIRVVKTLDRQDRAATVDEQEILGRWSGWGGAWQVFDEQKHEFDPPRAELRDLLTDSEYAAARRSTVNAHYTDPALSKVMWDALVQAGLPEQARVVEPGCGAGHFIGHAPDGVRMVGVELDAMTAKIAHRLYPNQQVRNHGFERDFAPDNTFTSAIGNVPFGDIKVYDDRHNPNGLSIHNHFIRKSLALTEPGGYVAVITSAFTSDAVRTKSREEIAELGDLVGGVRLPSKAFERQAKTDVVTDLLIFRRREADREQTEQTRQWIKSSSMEVGDDRISINEYFQKNPRNVLGTIRVGHGLHGRNSLNVDADTTAPLADQVRGRLDPIIEQAKAAGLALTAPAAQRDTTSELDQSGLFTAAELGARPIPGTLRYNEVANTFEQYTAGRWDDAGAKGEARSAEWRSLLAMGDTVLALVDASRTDTTFEHREQLRSTLGRQYDAYVAEYGHVNRYKWTSHASRNTDEQAAKRFPELERRWREANGDATIDIDGVQITEPFEGQLPEDVAQDLWERAYTPSQAPYKKRAHLEGVIKYDPRIALVRGIERYNDDTREAIKAEIFTEDISSVLEPATSADTVDEAIAISFDETGEISPARMAELLDTTVEDVLEQAKGKIYPDLDSDGWVSAAAFLSGNVRDKLARAQLLSDEDPARYADAVAALAKTVPLDVDPSKIGLRPGAAWVGTEIYRQFLVDEFGADPDRLTVEYAAVTGSWKIKSTQPPNWTNAYGYRDNWGLPAADMSGLELFESMCNNRPIQSRKTDEELLENPKPSFHKGRTEELRDRAERLEERFGQWLWSDPERTDRLTRRFNDVFNSFERIQHDIEHKTFPGLNPKYLPYPYQKQAVARLLNDETILLDHCVGAGKTLTIAMSCMEMKRLGQVQQPWIIVPNHLVDQWHREVLDAYPGANVLVATDLNGPADRQRFMGQSATGDWDMVIVPESKFKLMGVSPDTQIAYIEKEKMALAEALLGAKESGSGHTVKEIEKALASKEEQLQRLIKAKGKDAGITFEQTGCDFAFVDEAHMYKNLARPSNSSDLSVIDGAQRATDMDMKIAFLREQAIARNIEAGRPNAPAKAVAFATGTPVSNSMSELWVMQKYLRPDLLDELEMGHIDAWAQSFARQRTSVEMNVTGTQLRTVSRMAEYTNLPQMVAMVDQFRDVVVRDQIPADLPALRGGGRTIVEFELSQDVRDFMHDLDVRMQKTTGKTAHIDNALKIGNDGRNASLHPRLANLADPEPENDRVRHVVDQVWRVHTENADLRTPADGHGPAADGVFQIIFCDRGTPKAGDRGDDANLYAMVRAQLVERGMRPEDVAFIHDYPSAKDKQKLFADCRAGKVRVLIGSTEKMSTGVNAQRLLKALHHMDCPYRPADLEQREGRIIRQGNVNREVEILNYVAERSFDATMWQIVERKAHYIQQLRTGDVPHAIEDIGGDMALSAAQTKAAATGDPIYVDAVEKESEVKKLVNEEQAVAQINRLNEFMVRKFTREIPILRKQLEELHEIAVPITQWFDTDRDKRKLTIGEHTVVDSDSEKVGEALQATLQDRYTSMRMNRSTKAETLFEVAGVPVYGTYHLTTGALQLHTDGGMIRYLEQKEIVEAMSSTSATHGLMARVRNMLRDVEKNVAVVQRDLDETTSRLDAVRAEPVLEFTKGDELRRVRTELTEMNADINARENSPEALRRFAVESERRSRDGQYEQWTLDLNPTQGHAEAKGMTREDLSEAVPTLMQSHAADWTEQEAQRKEHREKDPWLPRSADGSVFALGGDRDSAMPGARVEWTDRMWHWAAWDGLGAVESGLTEQRISARGSAQSAAVTFAKAREIDATYLYNRHAAAPVADNTAPAAPDVVDPSPTATLDGDLLDGLRALDSREFKNYSVSPDTPDPDSGTPPPTHERSVDRDADPTE
ncbi:DEAD/DEAH box helicase family protein [Rhodococcus hoagii]|uniref:DEAD/DEAH box helicase family protein n=1 Tax=Rhodococcus hoagii TaxID=43767 RepID=UPI0019659985|nr:DEAD/DEAH box helicase family protein [Prescottella equi]MBM9839665.1 DEAD/DEAH box helicase family protein [Prescottella equi]